MSCLTGDETGLVKVWDISKKSGACSWSYGQQSRSRGIAAMCWVDGSTTQALINTTDGCLQLFDLKDKMMLSTVRRGVCAATASGLSMVDGKAVVIQKDGTILLSDYETPKLSKCKDTVELAVDSPIEATHVHRKHALVLCGGRENDLSVWDLRSERLGDEDAVPYFKARNVSDHVLGVPYPVYVTGGCFVTPNVFGVCTAYHDVRFYDRRVGERPVQEFKIDREISRRPTCMLQWNCNKYVIGEASGDIHLYDTRRGFASRAKLRGGVGSVRSMVKHPAGFQLLAAVGLDRKARIYHVPTGKLLQSIYLKQKGQSILFTKGVPFADDRESYCGVMNSKLPEKKSVLRDDFWDDMDPVRDEFEEDDGAEGDPRAQQQDFLGEGTTQRQPVADNDEEDEDEANGGATFGPALIPRHERRKMLRAAREKAAMQGSDEDEQVPAAEEEVPVEQLQDAAQQEEEEVDSVPEKKLKKKKKLVEPSAPLSGKKRLRQ